MDLKKYYRKLRDIEGQILDPYVVVKSLPTPDGGVAGRLTEVAKEVAAKMLADGLAEVAPSDAVEAFRREVEEQRRREELRRPANIQFTVLSEADLRSLRGGRGSKEKD
jgi:hypothetical protein